MLRMSWSRIAALAGLAFWAAAHAGTAQRAGSTRCVLYLNGKAVALVKSFDLVEARTSEKSLDGSGRPPGTEMDAIIESPASELVGWIHSNLSSSSSKRNDSIGFYGPDNVEQSRLELPEATLERVSLPNLRPFSDKLAEFSVGLRANTLNRQPGSRRAMDTAAIQALEAGRVKAGAFRFNIRQVDIDVTSITAWRAIRRPGSTPTAPLTPQVLDLEVLSAPTLKYFHDWSPNDFRNGAILIRNAAGKTVYQFSFEVNVLAIAQSFSATATAPSPQKVRLNLQKPSFSTSAP